MRAESATKTHAPAAPILPAHNYTYEKGGVYGYEPQLSQEQINAGAASAPLVMVRYLGEVRAVYQAEFTDGRATVVLSCSAPCHYITVRTYAPTYQADHLGLGIIWERNELIDREVIPAGDTLAGAIMQDAMDGQLRVYGSRRRAARIAQERRPPYVTTAVALIAANNRDQHALRQLLEWRRVQVNGTVAYKGYYPRTFSLGTTLLLRTSPELRLNFPHQLHHVHIGESVTALCQRMDDWSWYPGTPIGENCRLLK